MFADREYLQQETLIFGKEVAMQVIFFHACLLEMEVIQQGVFDVSFEKMGDRAGSQTRFCQPEATNIAIEYLFQLL